MEQDVGIENKGFTSKGPTSALHIVKQKWHWGSKGDSLPLPLPGHIKKAISATCLLKMDKEKHVTQNLKASEPL